MFGSLLVVFPQVPGDTGYDSSISRLPDTLQTLSLWVYFAFFIFCPKFMDVVAKIDLPGTSSVILKAEIQKRFDSCH